MASIIKNRTVIDDDAWQVVRAAEDGALPAVDALPAGKVLVPFAYWQAERAALVAAKAKDELGVWLAPDSEPADLVADFDAITLVGVEFPRFADGRGYSIARLLRERYGWTGELRAIGDVLRDQLFYMARCGFDAFAVRADKDIHDALNAFGAFSVRYQTAVDETQPLFRRRAAAAAASADAKAGA
ncbi:DUF934 domain-containing protein [Burkholderia guangdongensis]|uniref:DUF934 domain-containing protein n=1 Tax=Burkholderia guangdongensis TaxID=1792500 RepID=UPI0015CC12B5|nr:DUF934 domain-containing protein [Burkholderia guangdongensis]